MENIEAKILEFIDDNGLDIFKTIQLSNIEGLSDNYINQGLNRLIESGLLKRIEKGIYCRHNFSDELIIGSFLIKNGGIAYWSALNFHGLTEQIPNTVFVQTNQWKKSKMIFEVQYKFAQVNEKKVFGYKTEGYGNHKFNVTDIEKTIIDSFDQPEYSGGYPEIIKAFNNAHIDQSKLIRYCKAFGNRTIIKRLAYLTELLNKPKMEKFIRFALTARNEKYTPFLSYGEKKNKTYRRWRLILNLPEEDIVNMAQS